MDQKIVQLSSGTSELQQNMRIFKDIKVKLILLLLTTMEQFLQVDQMIAQLNSGTFLQKKKLQIYKDIKISLVLLHLTTLEQF